MTPPGEGTRSTHDAQSLYSFLTLLSAVTDETERARLTTTAISSLIPCELSGVALLGETDRSWRLLLQCDGNEMASDRTEDLLVDLEPLFEAAVHQPSLLHADTTGHAEHRVPPSIQLLGVGEMAVAPLATLRNRLGAIVVGKRVQERWSQEHEVLLLTLAEHTAVNTENHRFFESVADRTAELEAFSYSVSHDLRGPLRIISGFSRTLLEDHAGQLDTEGLRLLSVVLDSCRRMQQLIDDLLSFAHLQRRQIALMEIDMAGLAKAAFDEVATLAQQPVLTSFAPLPSARGDEAMVRQVWVNLLSNAVKFTKTESAPSIEVGYETEDGVDIYFVRDNGIGFDDQHVDKLFGVFERAHSSPEFEGTGVGLAIAARIVQRHGGSIWAEGRINEGTTVYFTLPRKSGSLAAGEPPRPK